MAEQIPLAQLVTVRSRFSRSVSLPRDWDRQDSLDGYILTPGGREILNRFASALRGETPSRAWTLTGPYGSGKSAFALFAAHLFGGSGKAAERAKEVLKAQDAKLAKKLLTGKSGSLCPILVTGSREALEPAIAAGVLAGLKKNIGKIPKPLAKKLEDLASPTGDASASRLVDVMGEVIEAVSASDSGYAGVVLIVDELGKFLEYAATHPEDGDVFILQSLAEAASRSEKPFLLVTILHQAIDRYTAHISSTRRQEWAKVQGRFEDIAFEEPTEQVVRLMAQAIEHDGPEPAVRGLAKQGTDLAGEAWALKARIGGLEKKEFTELLTACMPLHPTVALVLGPLFRRLAQNERSLFAFLTSGERHGFQEFLRTHTRAGATGEVFRLDQVYDYVTTALGGSLYSQHRGKYWSEVQSVLDRLHDATPLELRVAKTIGLVQALGYSAGVPASRDFLRYALASSEVTEKQVDSAIKALEARSVAVYRRHAGSYALWEGSDVDIEARIEEAKRAVDPSRDLSAYLADLAPPRPLVARRHSYHTGTLRYFEVAYADRKSLPALLEKDFGEADGRIVYCLPFNPEDRAAMEKVLHDAAQKDRPAVIAALPKELFDLKEACQELACLQWVTTHTPELSSDATARRELRARLGAAEATLADQLRRIYTPGSDEAKHCRWFRLGKEVPVASQRSLNELLSAISDEVFPHTPCWRNEMLNRRSLSSSAAAAQRNLLEAMIEHGDKDTLGIEGFPPERSMYDSILKASGLHRSKVGKWGFYKPLPKADPALEPMWKAVESFFTESSDRRRPVAEFFDLLAKPPFGLKDGVIPVVFATALLYYDTEAALYEEGTFIPNLTVAVFERLLASLDRFEMQHCRVSGPRAVVFSKYATMLSRPEEEEESSKPKLLSVVRPLMKFVKSLPDYVGHTMQVSATAKAVYQAIKEAREPDQLLFVDLPKACESEPFRATGSANTGTVDAFFGKLRLALAELQQTFPKLQSAIEQIILKAFALPSPLAQARNELSHRARLVSELSVEQKLKAFLVRVLDTGTDDQMWLESLAALLGNKPPQAWTDADRARFEVNVALTARTFQHFEALAFEMERKGAALLDGDDQAIRVAVTVPYSEEMERVVRIPGRLSEQAGSAQRGVRQALETAGVLKDKEFSVAILAQVVRQLLSETTKKE